MLKLTYNEKLTAMALLISCKVPDVGRTALNKLLFFADLAFFLENGRTITNAPYVRMPYGPVPEGIEVTRKTLIKAELLNESRIAEDGYYQYRYGATQIVDTDKIRALFDSDELLKLDVVLSKLGKLPASVLSEKSHEYEPWLSSNSGDELAFQKAKSDIKLIRWMRMNDLVSKNVHVPASH